MANDLAAAQRTITTKCYPLLAVIDQTDLAAEGTIYEFHCVPAIMKEVGSF